MLQNTPHRTTPPPDDEPWHPIFVSLLITGAILVIGLAVADCPYPYCYLLGELTFFLVGLPVWSPVCAAAIFLVGYRRWLAPDGSIAPSKRPRIYAAILLIPTLPMTLIASVAIPELFHLQQRLDNVRWQFEVCFALVALCAVALSLPGLICRTNGKRWRRTSIVWPPPIAAYSLVFCYALQSYYFDDTERLVVSTFSIIAIAIACLGLCADRQMPSSSAPSPAPPSST